MSIISPAVSPLPNNLTNGTPNDASQVMADFNQIRNDVNNHMSSVSASSGAAYIGVTTDGRWWGTSAQDALAQLISTQQLADTGVVNAYAFSTTPSFAAYPTNLLVWLKIANTNTSTAVTLAGNGLTAATVVLNSDGVTAPPIGSMIAGQIYGFWYSTTASKWMLINPSRATGSATITLTGMTATITGTMNYVFFSDGKAVQAWFAAGITGTSNATTMTATGIPPSLSAATNKTLRIYLEDATAFTDSCVFGVNTTTWTFAKAVGAAGGFTASGTKGINVAVGLPSMQSYTLD